jgi:AraC-like DNA-binding protein
MTSMDPSQSQGQPFQLSDVDEARQYVVQVYGSVKLEPTDRQPFRWSVKRALVDQIYLASSWFRGGAHFITEDTNDRYFLFFSRRNRGALGAGADAPIIPGRAAALRSPSKPGDLRVESDYQPLTIAISRPYLEAAFRALTHTSKPISLCFEPGLPTTSGVGASIQRLVGYMFDEVEHDGSMLRSPLVAAHLAETLMCSLLEGVPHNQMALLRSRVTVAAPSHVRRVAEHLEANAAEPVRMEQLAALVGVSIRSIQAGFKAVYGCSPVEFLKQRRLELARRRLLSATPGAATVTEIALDCGFGHVGRFSSLYRERFHEPPSATIRRSSLRQG